MLSNHRIRLIPLLLAGTWFLFSAAWLTACGPLPPTAGTSPAGQYSAGELETAHLMAMLSRLSYLIGRDEATLTGELLKKGYQPPFFFSHGSTGTAAYITRSPDTVVVVFRGTSGLRDTFFVDLNFSKVPGIEGQVHAGFHQAYEALKDEISGKINQELTVVREGTEPKTNASPNLFFAGHSLGSALAQLMALHVQKSGINVHGVFTFGSPRVGDGCFASAYNERLGEVTYHHKMDGDRVSEVPFVWQGYSHTGRQWRLLDPVGGGMANTQPDLEIACGDVIRGQERSPEDDETIQEAREAIEQALDENGDGTRGLISGNHGIALYESLMEQLLLGVGLRFTPVP